MKKQLDLLRDTPWQLLIVLDACRYDEFKLVVPTCECAWSPAQHTPSWIGAITPLLREWKPIYVTGNEIALQALPNWVDVVDGFTRHWGRFTRHQIPSVHPMSLVALAIEAADKNPDRRIVWHAIQPHMPYIGEPFPLGYGLHVQDNWKTTWHRILHKWRDLRKALKEGRVSWDQLRIAYRANLRLGWEGALNLMSALGYHAVVTADHGELLGERGGYAHPPNPEIELLHRVPWLDVPVPAPMDEVGDRLRAMGYI